MSINKDKYDEIMKAKPYVPKHSLRRQINKNDTNASNILAQTSTLMAAATNDSINLGEIERANRFKYGVKKPANVWRHEMDDNRITGCQIRTTNFRNTMFDADKEAKLRSANRTTDL